MDVFLSTLSQLGFLFLLVAVGFLLGKAKILPDGTAQALSKLENTVFIPALVLGTFMDRFTVPEIRRAGSLLLAGIILTLVSIPVAILLSKTITKDRYLRKIFTYGLAFSNFGFMGNAVVKALFPEIFLEYLLFTLPLWAGIYLWGVPALLMPETERPALKDRLKKLANPMTFAMLAGALIGLSGLVMPVFFRSAVTVLGDTMSPVAMLLTGLSVAAIDLKKTFTDGRIYLGTFYRLILLPLAVIGLARFIPLDRTTCICLICAVSMPLGLNPIVVPAAYGLDTSVATGGALISQLISAATIPLIFWLAV